MTAGNVISVSASDKPVGSAIAWFVGASLIPILMIIASIRLWRGEGQHSGSLVAMLLLFDLALLTPMPNSLLTTITLVVRVVLILLIVNGVRGAFAKYGNDSSGSIDQPLR